MCMMFVTTNHAAATPYSHRRMSSTQPAAQISDPADFGVQHWLDDLVAGSVSQDEFLHEVRIVEEHLPQVLWEALALLEQYYRSRKITQRDFLSLKKLLQRGALGFVDEDGDAAPSSACRG